MDLRRDARVNEITEANGGNKGDGLSPKADNGRAGQSSARHLLSGSNRRTRSAAPYPDRLC